MEPSLSSSPFHDCGFNYWVCGLIASGYVGSLYVWKHDKNQTSTHPSVMKRRFISVASASVIAPFIVSYFIHPSLIQNHSLGEILGVRLSGLFTAVTLPLFLTSILFLGPLIMQCYSGLWRIYIEPTYWFTSMRHVVVIRNYVMAPVTEEFVFRACIISLIIHCTGPYSAIFICPLFFGAAHLHHMLEQIRLGVPWKNAVFLSCFQFMYTFIFGAYSAYLFLRTGHLIAPVVVHAFCNHMGFPDFASIRHLEQPKKNIVIGAFSGGLVLWMFLLKPLTSPSLYQNNLPWVAHVL